MRLLIILIALFFVGCVHNVDCPKRMNPKAGDRCMVLYIPTPADPVLDTMQTVGAVRQLVKEGG